MAEDSVAEDSVAEDSVAELDDSTMDLGRKVLLQLVDISKVYELGSVRFQALTSVSFNIYDGEYVAITGPSGSGKSTLMHLIGCLDVPTSGRLLIDGKDVSRLDELELAQIRNERIGFVFQQFNLLAPLTALQNVELPLMYGSYNKRERGERSLALLERVGLTDHVRHRPNELSGGQQQRVAIARALVVSPSLILADEPTGNLDSKNAFDVLDLFDELHEAGRTIVVITHDSEVASRASRIIRIRDGQLEPTQ